jgi:hypothetical protein
MGIGRLTSCRVTLTDCKLCRTMQEKVRYTGQQKHVYMFCTALFYNIAWWYGHLHRWAPISIHSLHVAKHTHTSNPMDF